MLHFVPALGRLLIAAIFLLSGVGKIAAPAATQGYIASTGLSFPLVAYLIAIVVEVALALAAFTLATAITFHTAFGDQNQMIHFMKNLAIVGGLLQVAAFGAGSLSLDARRSRIGTPVLECGTELAMRR